MTARLTRCLRIALLCLAASLAVAGSAWASADAVIKDCNDHGRLTKRYSQKDYQDALANLPTDLDEYTDCRDVIRRAKLGAVSSGSRSDRGEGGAVGTAGGGSGGTGSSDGGTRDLSTDPLKSATPKERAAFEKAVDDGAAPIAFDGRPITPGALGGARADDLLDLPAPLLAVLGLLAAAGLGGAAFTIRRLVVGRHLP